jgi:diacylglycerol kinase
MLAREQVSNQTQDMRLMSPRFRQKSRLPRTFAVAAAGMVRAMRTERNFVIHLLAALAVVVAAAALGVSRLEWCILILCIAVVLAAELFNTAIEHLARAITEDENDEIRDALDIASGAVLTVAIGAAVVGVLILLGSLIWR